MDVQASPISPTELYRHLGTAKAPLLIDVRRAPAFDSDDQRIVAAARKLPDDVASWASTLPKGRAVVAYCVHGHEVSQGVAGALKNAGFQAAYLEGGIASWKDRKLPTLRKPDATENKWITREHPKVDRIACPWLVSRFINPEAEFIYVPSNDVAKVAAEIDGSPYDIDHVKFGHVGDHCSFDAIARLTGSKTQRWAASPPSYAVLTPRALT
jgi:rhodanese-related sulfurtransferase